MQVILLQDVGGVGRRGTLKVVQDGYALNFLIPKRLAEQATPAKIAAHEAQKATAERAEAEREGEWASYAKRLEGVNVAVLARSNEQGHLYTQLKAEQIIACVRELLGIDVPPDAIAINMPIRSVGETTVEFVKGKHRAKFTVTVKPFGK